MQASRSRQLKYGAQYQGLIAKGTGKQSEVMQFPSTKETVQYMLDNYKKDAWQVEKLARVLKGATLFDSCRNLWQFLYDHVQYRLDPVSVELVRTPAATWRDRAEGVDCDCYAYFIACVLHHWKAPFSFRRADYGNGWQHVYVAVPQGSKFIIIDPVLDRFNQEHPYKRKNDMSNSLARLDGTPSLGKTIFGKIFQKIGNTAERVGKGVLKAGGKAIKFVNRYVNPATIGVRNGFLLSMKMNIFNVAKRIRYAYWTEAEAKRNGWTTANWNALQTQRKKMEKTYEDFGGKAKNLKKAILTGKANKDGRVKADPAESTEEFADELEFQILALPDTTPPNATLKLTPIAAKPSGMNGIGQVYGIDGLGNTLYGNLGAELATGSALIALASSAVAVISKALDVIPFPSKKDSEATAAEVYSYEPDYEGMNPLSVDSESPKAKEKSILPWLVGGVAVLGVGTYIYMESEKEEKTPKKPEKTRKKTITKKRA